MKRVLTDYFWFCELITEEICSNL